jgi:hypothetical protein
MKIYPECCIYASRYIRLCFLESYVTTKNRQDGNKTMAGKISRTEHLRQSVLRLCLIESYVPLLGAIKCERLRGGYIPSHCLVPILSVLLYYTYLIAITLNPIVPLRFRLLCRDLLFPSSPSSFVRQGSPLLSSCRSYNRLRTDCSLR